jgi:ribose transport system ATP-binding protein
MHPAPSLRLSGVSKRYGGVTALDGVDFSCAPGTIHAILGENGAGKSTLIKIISGVVQPDAGAIYLGDDPVRFAHPIEANRAGIVCVFQELSLLPTLSVADNIAIGQAGQQWGLLDNKAQLHRAEALLARVGCEDINPREWVGDLSLSRRQMVEIAKAIGKNPQLLILDEATSALTSADVHRVFDLLDKLRDEGVALLYISHRMHEIETLADVLSVFRNGHHIETFAKGTRTEEEIVQLMIGRDMAQTFPPKPVVQQPRTPVLEVDQLSWEDQLNDISLTLGKGEILGLGGLDGQGQKEFLLALFGALKDVRGTVHIDGQPAIIDGPHAAKRETLGLALVPEDRKTEGLILSMGIGSNLSLASLDRLKNGLVIDAENEHQHIEQMLERLQIKIGHSEDAVSSLSGGNQQKVVLAKWLMTHPKILMLNDPTRGIDVGTKGELYQLFRQLADSGTSILLYSTDYDELIGLCDRVMIFYQGRIVRQLQGDQISETNIVASALNMGTPASEAT